MGRKIGFYAVILLLLCSSAFAGQKIPGVLEVTGTAGIGTSAPRNKLDINGANAGVAGIYVNDAVPSSTTNTIYNDAGTLKFNGSLIGTSYSVTAPITLTGSTIGITTASTSSNGYLTATNWNTFNNKVSSQWTTSGSNIYYNGGNVGIGTTTITNKLTIENSDQTTSGIDMNYSYSLVDSPVTLLYMEGANGGSVFVDSSPPAHSMIAHGSVITSTTQKKYGSSSAYLDGTSWIAYNSDASDVRLTGDFTVQSWGYTTYSGSSWQTFYGPMNFGIRMSDNTMRSSLYYYAAIPMPVTIHINEWHHYAIVRKGYELYYFLDGKMFFNFTLSSIVTIGNPNIGGEAIGVEGYYGVGVNFWNGYLDDFKINKSALYYSDFTPNPLSSPIAVEVINYKQYGVTQYISGVIGNNYVIGKALDNVAFAINSSSNVGIGSTSPRGRLDVNGDIYADNFYNSGTPVVTTQWTTTGSNIYYNTGNVGIGTASPSYILDVVGSIGIGTTTTARTLVVDAVNSLVGIGTSTPSQALQVIGTIKATSYLGDGSLLTGISSQWDTNGSDINYLDGNVGIGTSLPSQALQVIGTVKATSYMGDGSQLTGLSGTISGLTDNYIIKADGASAIQISNIFDDDTNVGIGTAIPNTLLEVGASLFNVLSTGEVGIATSAPSQLLTVNGTVKAQKYQGYGGELTGLTNQTITLTGIATGSGTTSILTSAGTGYYMPETADQTNWNKYNQWDGASTGLGITTAQTSLGLVIGTNVEAAIAVGTTAQYWRGDKSWNTLNATAVDLGNVTNNAQVTSVTASLPLASSGTVTPNISIAIGSSTGSKLLVLSTSPTITTPTFSGNVSIGTTAVRQALDIIGTEIVSAGIGIATTSAPNLLTLVGSASIGSTAYTVSAPSKGLIVEGNVGIATSAPGMALQVSGVTLIKPNGVEGLYVGSSGRVGIATTAPTTALTVDGTVKAQYFSGNGGGLTGIAGVGITSVTVQTKTSSGTYTPTSGMTKVLVICVGAGGGIGAAIAADDVQSGGGGGGTAIKLFTAADIGASQTVTVGVGTTTTGGTSGLGTANALLQATGGAAGAVSGNLTIAAVAGGLGGIGTLGDLNIRGGSGGTGVTLTTAIGVGGPGGDSTYGGGGTGGGPGIVQGTTGGVYGGGGGGGHTTDGTDITAVTGGAGVVYFIEFL